MELTWREETMDIEVILIRLGWQQWDLEPNSIFWTLRWASFVHESFHQGVCVGRDGPDWFQMLKIDANAYLPKILPIPKFPVDEI